MGVKNLAASLCITGFVPKIGGIIINQLAFVDDCVLLAKVDVEEVRILGNLQAITVICQAK